MCISVPWFHLYKTVMHNSNRTNLAREAELELRLFLRCWWQCRCRFLRRAVPHFSVLSCHRATLGNFYHPWSRSGSALELLSPHRAAPQGGPPGPLLPSGQPVYWGGLWGRGQRAGFSFSGCGKLVIQNESVSALLI